MVRELESALHIPVQLVPLEELEDVLAQTRSGTVVTSRYFITEAEAIAAPKSVRVIPVDIYDYNKELGFAERPLLWHLPGHGQPQFRYSTGGRSDQLQPAGRRYSGHDRPNRR